MTVQFTCSGVTIDAVSLEEATDAVLAMGRSGRGGAVHLANVYSLSCATRDPGHRAALAAGDLVVPDGMPLVWVARRLGIPQPDRVYGPDLLDRVVRTGRTTGVRHHLYGGSPHVVARVAERLRERHPGAEVVAADAPPFGPLTEAVVDEAAERINAIGAHVVWVALGTPRQNLLSHRLQHRVPGVLVGVGAAFDFLAGAKPQAPRALQRAGLEWAFRLATEPRRLARRYAVGNTVFLRDLVRDPPRRLPDQAVSSS